MKRLDLIANEISMPKSIIEIALYCCTDHMNELTNSYLFNITRVLSGVTLDTENKEPYIALKELCLTPNFNGFYPSQVKDELSRLSDEEWKKVFELAAEEMKIVEETPVGIVEEAILDLQNKVRLSRRLN